MSIAVTLVNYEWQIGVSYWLMRLLAVGSFLALIACFMNALALLIKLGMARVWFFYRLCEHGNNLAAVIGA